MPLSHIIPRPGINRARALKIRSPTHNGWAGRALLPLTAMKYDFTKQLFIQLKVIQNEIYFMVHHDNDGSAM